MSRNPNLWICYHVRNNTCIHMRAGGPNIYMYRRGKYIKNPLEEYNNRKAYYTSNSTKEQISLVSFIQETKFPRMKKGWPKKKDEVIPIPKKDEVIPLLPNQPSTYDEDLHEEVVVALLSCLFHQQQQPSILFPSKLG
jgi:hypothetical protein